MSRLRVEHPDGNGNELLELPTFVMADGSRLRGYPRDSSFNDTVFFTDELWRYTTTSRTLEIPNGCDLPGDFRTSGNLREWRPRTTEGANEEDAIHRRADGHDPARGR